MKNEDVLNVIKSFVNGTGGEWDWDDFISIPIKDDPFLEEIRKKCAALPEEFPANKKGQYCSEEGFEVLKGYIRMLEVPGTLKFRKFRGRVPN